MDGKKPCDGSRKFFNNEALAKKDVEEKCIVDAGDFFDCRICLDVAKDPVVTCCGHLFCWPCLYRWLNIHSVARDCPVCKGEVSMKNITPINGRWQNDQKPETNGSLKIPSRPQARRVESWRQAFKKAEFMVSVEEMIRRLGCKFECPAVHPQNNGASLEPSERANPLLIQLLTSRGMRQEHNNTISPTDAVDFAPSSPTHTQAGESQINSTILPGSNTNPADRISYLASAFSSIEQLVELNSPYNLVDRNPELPFPVADRHDSWSIATDDGHSGSHTPESFVEIDSEFMRSTSSTRRRSHTSTLSDRDNEHSRPSRRRRN